MLAGYKTENQGQGACVRFRPVSGGRFIVAVGGTLRPESTGSLILRLCLAHAERQGARTALFTGDRLRMPLYDPASPVSDPASSDLVSALREADGILLASPGYHGGVSGTLKNALDYTEEMRSDTRCYFDSRAVGCIAAAGGWQAAAATLASLRGIVHALRGWPTPIGVMLNSSVPLFDSDGRCLDKGNESTLFAMVDQVLAFAAWQSEK